MRSHTLDTSTNSNVNHTGIDSVGNVGNSHETARALTVQTLDGSRLGETSNKGSSTELSGASTRSKDGTDGDILDELGVDLAAVNETFEHSCQQIGSGSVLETASSGLGDGRAESTSDDNVVGVLFDQTGDATLAPDMGSNLGKTLLRWKSVLTEAPGIAGLSHLPEDMMKCTDVDEGEQNGERRTDSQTRRRVRADGWMKLPRKRRDSVGL